MGKAIKIAFIYLGFQLLGTLIVIISSVIDNLVRSKPLYTFGIDALPLTLCLGLLFMWVYLKQKGYISKDERTWSPISVVYLIEIVITCLAFIFIVDFIMSLIPWFSRESDYYFSLLKSHWVGILLIVIFIPIIEELMFRGAILTILLKKYNPIKAIISSALIFGIVHIHPFQILGATLFGLLCGWIFYKSASLIPCILMHVLNNGLAVYFSYAHPYEENIRDVLTTDTYFIFLCSVILLFVGSILLLKQRTIPYPWKDL